LTESFEGPQRRNSQDEGVFIYLMARALAPAARHKLIALLAIVATMGIVTASAHAAVYKASRPGFSILLRTQGLRVVEVKARYTLHCTDRRVRRAAVHLQDRTVLSTRPGGKFSWRGVTRSDTISSTNAGQGTVHDKIATGSLFQKSFHSPGRGRESYACWTGRSRDDPRVRFVARRQ
jgi:hypothetical protein